MTLVFDHLHWLFWDLGVLIYRSSINFPCCNPAACVYCLLYFHWAPLSKVCLHLFCKSPLGYKTELTAGRSSIDFCRWFDSEQPPSMLKPLRVCAFSLCLISGDSAHRKKKMRLLGIYICLLRDQMENGSHCVPTACPAIVHIPQFSTESGSPEHSRQKTVSGTSYPNLRIWNYSKRYHLGMLL